MDKLTYEKGLEIRKSVLGAQFVENSIASADDFNRPLQELVTEYCWGAVWGREGLEKRTRSIINLAMISALNRPHELKMHVKGAIRNGVSKAEISEVLLQVGIYCGIPAAVDSFRVAKEALADTKNHDRTLFEMSDIYEVLAVKYAINGNTAAMNFIGGDAHDVAMPLSYFVWVIRNERRTVVVDTGFNAKEGARRGRTLVTPVAEAFAAIEVDPGSVADVITTHMHYDHAGNNDLFPNARFHLQECEMRFATGPCMCHAVANHPYDVNDVAGMVRRVYAGKVKFHSGDAQVFPGISVHHIGGHSRGLQFVRVDTASGPVILASDAMHLYAHLESRRVFPTCDSVSEALLGYDKLMTLGLGDVRRIVPGHDPVVMERYPAYNSRTQGLAVRLDLDPAQLF